MMRDVHQEAEPTTALPEPTRSRPPPARPPMLGLPTQAGNAAVSRLVAQRLTAPANVGKAAAARTKALKRQIENREFLRTVLVEGSQQAATDRRLANACEWVLTGRSKI